MTVVAVGSAQTGTKLATASDTKITGMTLAIPTSLNDRTPLQLVDAAAVADFTGTVFTLYSNDLIGLAAQVYDYKPNGPSAAPGLTAPVFPRAVISSANISFSKGVFVKSCPTGVSFSLTTG
jgi:hypothetical protein